MDRLETMMNMQGAFQQRLDPDFYDKTTKERVAFIKEHSIHLNQEINEMLYELPFFKPWKDYSGMSEEAQQVAMQKARMELIDAWHFFMNLALGLGFTTEEFYQMYCAKNAENHRRQDDGYTAEKSYKDQRVEDVMPASCTVSMNGKSSTSSNFVAVLVEADGSGSVHMHSDLVNLGIAANIMSNQYVDALNSCSEEDREAVMQSVTDAIQKQEKE